MAKRILPNDNRVSKKTKKLIRIEGYNTWKKKNTIKYYKPPKIKNSLPVEMGYNMLENQFFVRRYFQKKYDINLNLLELLLYLFPKNYFTYEEYKAFPVSYTFRKMTVMEKKGYVVKITKTKNRDRAVYGLSRHAKKLVTDYYEYLAGEKLIPVDKTNPYHGREDLNSHEKKVYDMMKKLKKSAG